MINIQEGNDDCREYHVDISQLEELLRIVNAVLTDHSKAEELLPVQSGFFFGSTDYDEYYFQDLETTKQILEKTMEDQGSDFDYYYRSSW